ncbi:MAG: hypothetical protein Q8L86_10195 [Vicinamibacterales bacterium]|nr:hypothetical protein [Vicinamibacterales bacterium]
MRAALLALVNTLTLGGLYVVLCRRGHHDPDPRFASLDDGTPAWECPRCWRRYPRADRGTWKPEEIRREAAARDARRRRRRPKPAAPPIDATARFKQRAARR